MPWLQTHCTVMLWCRLKQDIPHLRDHEDGPNVKRGTAIYAMMKLWEMFCQNVPHRFLIFVPILASPDPDGERVSFRTFLNLLCSDCELYFNCFEFEMSCMSDIISLAFSFHTPTFFTKVRISWNSWPLFSCWLRLCDVRFRLGSRVCVCVFVLFCSVVVVLCVVGRQQHCRYIVIDAMVYPRNWILEDELSTGKTLGVFGLRLVFQHLAFATEKILNLEVTTLCMSRTRWVLDDALPSIVSFGSTRTSLDIFWSWMWSGTWTFFCGYSIGIRIWQWCEWMRCHVERGYGNLTPCGSTLWVRVKRHVIHHGCIVCAQKIRGRLLQEFIASWKIGREHSTYCGRNLVCDHPVSQYSIGLRTYCFWHQSDVIDQCWPVIVVYGSVLHLILDSTWVWYGLLPELKILTLVWHWDYFLCPRRSWTRCIVKLILSKWWEHSYKLLEKSLS